MSWEQLRDIYREAADELRAARGRPPVACPNDGEPLQPGPGGALHCPWGDYEYPRDRVSI